MCLHSRIFHKYVCLFQDNCGTFDRLVPLLPPHLGFLAIDAPGHGLSSHYPPGFRYTIFDLPIVIRKFSKEFEWKKVSLIGHSMGSIQSFLYTCIFDDQVDMYVGIDIMFPLMADFKIEQANKYEKRIDQLLKYVELEAHSNEPPAHTYEDCIERYFHGAMESVTRDMAPYILNRGIAPSKNEPGKFYFTRDVRVKVNNIPSFSETECLNLAKTVKAPTFIIKATNSRFYSHTGYYLDIINKMKSSIQIFDHIELPGTHHLHLLTPDAVAGPINDFVMKYDTEDRSQKSNLIDEIFVKKYA